MGLRGFDIFMDAMSASIFRSATPEYPTPRPLVERMVTEIASKAV
jgi:hypothetical protein